MKSKYLLANFLLMALFLVGCSTPTFKTNYRYEPPKAQRGKMCVAQCQKELTQCQSGNSAAYNQCLIKQKELAQQAFDAYKQANQSQNDLAKTLESFYHPEECQKPSAASCKSDFRICYELCGGKVAFNKQCTKNCSAVKTPAIV